MVKIAYSATYDSTDVTNATIDLLATVGVAFVGFGSLIGLVLLYKWFTDKKKVDVR